MIGRGGLATLTDDDDPGAGVRPVGAFLYEPDGAVIRAGLVTAVAAGVDGGLLDPKIAYVTGDESFRTPFARGYRVLERLPYREKPLKAALRERGIGTLTIKKRGVSVSPDELRQRLGLRGDRTATLVMTRVDGARCCAPGRAVLTRPDGRAVIRAPRARPDGGVVAVAGVDDGVVGQREQLRPDRLLDGRRR